MLHRNTPVRAFASKCIAVEPYNPGPIPQQYMQDRCYRFLSVADVPRNPNSGAAGTTFQTNAALRELGHQVDEIWEDQLGPRRISHGNLHSLLEQPRQYADSIRAAYETQEYDVVLCQQPQSWLAARDHRTKRRKGIFLTVSQGVETRIWPILETFRRRLGIPSARFPHRLLTPLLQRLLARQWARAARYSDGIVVQHTEDRDFICDYYGLDPHRVHISASGLPPEFLERPVALMTATRRRKLLHVGQLAFYKGVSFLTEAINLLLAAFPDVEMTWVCNQSNHADARRLFAENVRDRVNLVAWQPQTQLIDLLDAHGIFIFPTLAEGFAKAPLEAMARGLCVVASDCCGMRDYVKSDLGYRYPVGDVAALTEIVCGLLNGSRTFPDPNALHSYAQMYTWRNSTMALSHFAALLRGTKA